MLSSFSEGLIVTVEDNMLVGGFGSMIAEYFSDSGKRVKIFAYRDSFIEQGDVEELMNDYGLNADDIAEYILKSV